jgi:hypothetical protein
MNNSRRNKPPTGAVERADSKMKIITTNIDWYPADWTLPDEELSVLVCTRSGEVEQGFLEDRQWYWCSGGAIDEEVVGWAELPDGKPVLAHMEAGK